MVKLLGISGSLRAGSYNSMLVREAARFNNDPVDVIAQPRRQLGYRRFEIRAKVCSRHRAMIHGNGRLSPPLAPARCLGQTTPEPQLVQERQRRYVRL